MVELAVPTLSAALPVSNGVLLIAMTLEKSIATVSGIDAFCSRMILMPKTNSTGNETATLAEAVPDA